MSSGNKGPWGNLGNRDPKPSRPAGQPGGGGPKGPGGGGNGGGKNPFDFKMFNPGSGAPEVNITSRGILVIIMLAVIGWAMTGFYVVDASEEGVVLRFGKFHRTAPEGLRYHLPAPLEKAYVVRKTFINSIQIGYRSSAGQRSARGNGGQETKQLKESLMITGDTNIADVTFTIQWRIKNSFDYLFQVANPYETMEGTIKSVAESAMREVIGRTRFVEAMTTGRSAIEKDVQAIIQTVLDSYNSGVEIYAVNLNDVQNPELVMPAFLDVETAKQDRETAINRAMAYQNEVIPKARGQAQKVLQEAEAYKQEVISIASGEAARFASVYDEYAKAKDVTRKRIYLETMQQILAGTDKVIMPHGGSGVVPYLPLPELKKRNSQNQTQVISDETN